MSFAFVTPSYIESNERLRYAEKSFRSLRNVVGNRYPHYVVDDCPRISYPFGLSIPNPLRRPSEEVYQAENVKLVRQWWGSSLQATHRAIDVAESDGVELAFIHLDDNVYIPAFRGLLDKAIDAFERRPSLQMVRLTGVPILSRFCTKELGNRTELEIEENAVRFENVVLRPQRFEDYTLWTSPFHQDLVEGRFYAIPMWFAVFRVSFLRRLFEIYEMERGANSTLADVEAFYKDAERWSNISTEFSGEMGYINMQFGGLEMQWNENWEELVQLPNEPVR